MKPEGQMGDTDTFDELCAKACEHLPRCSSCGALWVRRAAREGRCVLCGSQAEPRLRCSLCTDATDQQGLDQKHHNRSTEGKSNV